MQSAEGRRSSSGDEEQESYLRLLRFLLRGDGRAPSPEADPRRCAIQVAHVVVIAYVVLFIFALVGYFLTVVLPWFLKVVVPIAWP